tara:strand:+ start:7397 stop:8506 length:1110 start_codon:yes stop_codon:yes gene_type:complete
MNEKSITILEPGLLSSIQDIGRYGFQKYGVPVSGAMDSFALRSANVLVGNEMNDACIEMTVIGPSIKFNYGALISVTGGDLSIKINGEKVDRWSAINVEAGSVLTSDGIRDGMRAYLAISGGINVPVIMGSRSTYIPAAFGGYKGRPLMAGDELLIGDPNPKTSHIARTLPEELEPVHYGHSHIIRVVLGPQNKSFTTESINTFFDSRYVVSNNCDRTGYRLSGPQLKHQGNADIISDGTQIGSIQVPADGNPIILMSDRGPTGGYAKIGTVISTDLGLIAQSRPDDNLVFRQVSVKEAESAFLEQESILYSMDPNIFKNASDKVKSTLSKTSSSLSPYLENDQNKLDMTATAKLKGKTFSFGISIESN